jgi:hypothetical protein
MHHINVKPTSNLRQGAIYNVPVTFDSKNIRKRIVRFTYLNIESRCILWSANFIFHFIYLIRQLYVTFYRKLTYITFRKAEGRFKNWNYMYIWKENTSHTFQYTCIILFVTIHIAKAVVKTRFNGQQKTANLSFMMLGLINTESTDMWVL